MTDLTWAKDFVANSELMHMSPDELAHYGVLGQRWGHRKSEGRSPLTKEERYARNTRQKLAVGTLGASVVVPKIVGAVKTQQAAKAAKASDDHRNSRELLKKKSAELSNSDIEKIVNRLQKEQNLKRLNPSSVDRGKKITLGLIAAAGTGATVYNLIHSPAGQAAVKQGAQIVQTILTRRIA